MDTAGGCLASVRRGALFWICLISALGATGSAAAFCNEPAAPYCLRDRGKFADERSMRDCRWNVESYVTKLRDHANCLVRDAEVEGRRMVEEAQHEAYKARDKAEAAAARFECKADGDRVCY